MIKQNAELLAIAESNHEVTQQLLNSQHTETKEFLTSIDNNVKNLNVQMAQLFRRLDILGSSLESKPSIMPKTPGTSSTSSRKRDLSRSHTPLMRKKSCNITTPVHGQMKIKDKIKQKDSRVNQLKENF